MITLVENNFTYYDSWANGHVITHTINNEEAHYRRAEHLANKTLYPLQGVIADARMKAKTIPELRDFVSAASETSVDPQTMSDLFEGHSEPEKQVYLLAKAYLQLIKDNQDLLNSHGIVVQ